MTLVAIILGGPFLAMAILGLLPPLRRTGRPAAYVSILGIGASLVASIALFLRFRANPEPWELGVPLGARSAGTRSIEFGVLVDGLSVSMLVVVSLVAFVVQVYSLGYMNEETPGSLGRYFTFQSLFAFAMLGLVASHNTLQTYVFWELVGLGSYLLIGFWYQQARGVPRGDEGVLDHAAGRRGLRHRRGLLWAAGGIVRLHRAVPRRPTRARWPARC